MHPYVVGEIALGYLNNRVAMLRALTALPVATIARHPEVVEFIEQASLFGTGLELCRRASVGFGSTDERVEPVDTRQALGENRRGDGAVPSAELNQGSRSHESLSGLLRLPTPHLLL